MRILVVEDEPKGVRLLKQGFQEEGYAVDVARDGEQAVYRAQLNDYDVIILDILLPKLDGLAVCRELRSLRLRTPILMLTARDALEDRVEGLDSGADDYLVKPFAFAELLARVRALLRRASAAPEALSLEHDGLCLDPVSKRVTVEGEEVNLSQKEFALLEYFMRHAGAVLSRTQLYEHVWERESDTFTNIIDVYVSYLRKKIDRGRRHRYLHTIHGRGYLFESRSR